ncbi:C45 family autoproteolytic acyltransferase/hydolase [Vibrio sp. 10N.261.51.F12]|uniref:C45 family autoproteolytic acyltransferase/hydolase n=1 Tax=Vibrio sp. 10N.261.51.F12 TaxID=3229679 RepID=UPI0035522181
MKKSIIALALATMPLFVNAASTELSQTGVNGVTVQLTGSYYAPNDKESVQETTPVIEFEGLTKKGGQQIVEGYRSEFGKHVFKETIKEKLAAVDAVLTEEQKLSVLKTKEQMADYPEIFDFYSGMAEATGYSLDEVYLAAWSSDGLFADSINGLAVELFEYLGEATSKTRGCTALAFNNGISGQNQDMPIEFAGLGAIWKSKNLIVHAPEPFFTPIVMGRNVANNTNTVDAFLDGAIEHGVPAGAISMAVISKAKSTDDVVKALDKVEVNAAYSFTMTDTSGNALLIETTQGDNIVIDGSERGWVVQANHPVGQEEELVNKYANGDYTTFNETVKYTLWRQEAAESAARYTPTKDKAALKDLFAKRPILQMPYEGNGFVSTNSIIHDLNEGCSYGTTWVPTMQEYTKVCFDK